MAEDQRIAEFFNIMRAAFEPIARVCFIALVGWVLAWDRVGLLTPDKRAFLSQINMQVFLP